MAGGERCLRDHSGVLPAVVVAENRGRVTGVDTIVRVIDVAILLRHDDFRLRRRIRVLWRFCLSAGGFSGFAFGLYTHIYTHGDVNTWLCRVKSNT